VDRFNRLAQANGWDDKRKKLTIPTYFRGFAELAYNAIPLDIRTEMKFNDLVERLSERFLHADNAELKGYLLHNRRQGTSEPVLTYALGIQQLTLEAYPDVSATTLDTLMKRFFIDGLNCKLWRQVTDRKPKSSVKQKCTHARPRLRPRFTTSAAETASRQPSRKFSLCPINTRQVAKHSDP